MKKLLLTFNFYLFTFSFFLLPFPFLQAQWSTSPDSALQIGVGDETYIISDGNGGAFVLFDGDGWVRLQKIDRYGYVQWSNITPQGGIAVGGNPADTCLQEVANEHSLVLDDQGGVYVSFHDFCFTSPYTTVSTVRLQRVDSLGNLLWGADGMPVSIRNSYQTSGGAIVTDGTGGIIVLYNEKDSVNSPTKLYAQRFDAAGNRLWGNEGIVVKELGGFKDVASDENGGIVFGYIEEDSSFMQRINPQGQKLWGNIGVYIPSGASYIAVYINGSCYAASKWYIGSSRSRIAVQKLNLNDGSLQWESLGVTIDTIDVNSEINDFSLDTYGNIWIAWYRIWGETFIQKLSPSGLLRFPSPGIQPSTFSSNKFVIALESSQDSSIIVTWVDNRIGSSGIYGQRISSNGSYIWGNDTYISDLISSGGLKLISDGSGGGIVNWVHLGSFGIYIQQVSRDGNLGEVLTSINTDNHLKVSEDFILHQNYPNPFNASTIFSFQLNALSDVELKIFDSLGQEVKKLISEKLLPGFHEIDWNGTDEDEKPVASGVYYYRLKVGNRIQTRKMLLVR